MKFKKMLSCIKNIWWKYELNLPLIKRRFDSIFLSYKNINSAFWYFFDDLYLDNIILWISKINHTFLFYKLDLNSVVEEEYILKNIIKINKNILNKKYSFLFLEKEDFSIKIITNFKNNDFDFYIEKDIFFIKNKILNSIILEKKLNLKNNIWNNYSKINFESSKYTSILDVYFLENYFIKTKNSILFNEKIENFIFENKFLDKEFLPKNILKIYEKWYLKNKKHFWENIFFWKQNKNFYKKLELLKIFLEFKNYYNLRLDLINYWDLEEYFIEFEDNFTLKKFNQNRNNIKIDFSRINIEKIDKNLISINKQIWNFVLNYYNLEESFLKIKNLENNLENTKILEQKNRLEITKENIEKIKKEYLEYFKIFLDKIQ